MAEPAASLVIFCRLPVPGRVKTRLAATIGPDAACAFYKACAEHILQVALSCMHVRPVVFHSHGDDPHAVEQWVQGVAQEQRDRIAIHCQSPGTDLGDKMQHALSTVLALPGCSKALIIGSDIPDITVDLLVTAVQALDSHPDGGYYLLGVTQTGLQGSLFQGIPWSTPTVLQDTLARAAGVGLLPSPMDTLPTLRDIDVVQGVLEFHADGILSWDASVHICSSRTATDLQEWSAQGSDCVPSSSAHSSSTVDSPDDEGGADARYAALKTLAYRLCKEADQNHDAKTHARG